VLHLWYGPDSFSRAEAVGALTRELDVDGMLATNTTRFDGRNVQPDELLAACDTVPFLAAARLVIVDGLLSAQEGRRRTGRGSRARGGRQGDESPWSALVEYVPRMPPSTHLLLLDGEVRADHPLLAALRPLGDVRPFARLERDALERWIGTRVKERGAAIMPRAVAVLAESVGADLWQLNNEIEKLALYAGDRPIDVSDVRLLVAAEASGGVFQLVDAVMAGNGAEALRLTRLLLDGGAAGPYLLTMLARQFRQFLLLRDMHVHGVPRAEMARRLELRSDYLLGRLLEQARRYPEARLVAGYERILEADLSTKRGQQDEDSAVELLVAEVAGLR
jgi:DNA polymerase-3 subunit delta